MEKVFNINVRVTVESRYPSHGNDHISVDESFDIPEQDFISICKILGEFKSLADEIRGRASSLS